MSAFRWDRVRKPGATLTPEAMLAGPVAAHTWRRLRGAARDAGIDVPLRHELTEGEALDLIGYAMDVAKGRR